MAADVSIDTQPTSIPAELLLPASYYYDQICGVYDGRNGRTSNFLGAFPVGAELDRIKQGNPDKRKTLDIRRLRRGAEDSIDAETAAALNDKADAIKETLRSPSFGALCQPQQQPIPGDPDWDKRNPAHRSERNIASITNLISVDADNFSADTSLAEAKAELGGLGASISAFQSSGIKGLGGLLATYPSKPFDLGDLKKAYPDDWWKSTEYKRFKYARMGASERYVNEALHVVGEEMDGRQSDLTRIRFGGYDKDLIAKPASAIITPVMFDPTDPLPKEARFQIQNTGIPQAEDKPRRRPAANEHRDGSIAPEDVRDMLLAAGEVFHSETDEWWRFGANRGRLFCYKDTGAIWDSSDPDRDGSLKSALQVIRGLDEAGSKQWISDWFKSQGRGGGHGGARPGSGRPKVDRAVAAAEKALEAAAGDEGIQTADREWIPDANGNMLRSSPGNAIKGLEVIGRLKAYQFNLFGMRVERVDGADFNLDAEMRWARDAIERAMGFAPTHDAMSEAIQNAAEMQQYNPVTDWLDSLRWDGIERLGSAAETYFGSEGGVYPNLLVKAMFQGMVSRAYRPGITYAYMPILQGPQGIGKSSAVRLLSMDPLRFYLEGATFRGLDWQKKIQERAAGKWAVEVAELQALGGEGMSNAKEFVTDTHVENRLSYKRGPTRMAIGFVMFGTTNQKEFLHDTTGLRRFPVLQCRGTLDLDGLEAALPQLYAEARDRWVEEGRGIVRLPEEFWGLAEEDSQTYSLSTSYEDWAAAYLDGKEQVLAAELVVEWGKVGDRVSDSNRSAALHKLGWKKGWMGSKRAWVKRVDQPPQPPVGAAEGDKTMPDTPAPDAEDIAQPPAVGAEYKPQPPVVADEGIAQTPAVNGYHKPAAIPQQPGPAAYMQRAVCGLCGHQATGADPVGLDRVCRDTGACERRQAEIPIG